MKLRFFDQKWATLSVGILLSLSASESFAAVNLKKVQVTDGSQIDLLFDGKVNPNQIRTEFFNDIIQLSLTETSVYPAKISSVSGTELTKVFAYQYAPKLVRCRLTVKGKAENYQKKLSVKANGKIISIRLDDALANSDKITQTSAKAEKASSKDETPAKTEIKEAKTDTKISDAEEKALLDRVMKASKEPSAPVAVVKESAEKSPPKDKESAPEPIGKKKSQQLTGGKPLPSLIRPFMMLAGVLALFGGLAFLVKKFKANGPSAQKSGNALSGMLGKLTQNKFGKKGKMIEVVATHYLGPKNSIAMVRVAGRLLVLGVSNESISLITQLPEGAAESLEEFAESPSGAEAVLKAVTSQSKARMSALDLEDMDLAAFMGEEPVAQKPASVPRANPNANSNLFADVLSQESRKPSVRAQIKSRIEGMKQL